MKKKYKSSTQCVLGGRDYDDHYHSIIQPVIHSAPFTFKKTDDLIKFRSQDTKRTQPEYTRYGNPTISYVEKRIASLEGGERAQLFASGMCAITTTLLTILKKGDHVITTDDSYRRTKDFIVNFLPKFGISSTVTPPDVLKIKKSIRKNTRVIFTECPTNPFLKILDVAALGEIGRSKGILTIVDSTLATPINLRPLEFGIDMVLHSATKYLGGHNDLIAGIIVGSEEVVQPVYEFLRTMGGISDPMTAFLLDRGLKTLALRVHKHNENGRKIAEYLEGHPKVIRVFYPSLKSHEYHELAKRQMDGFGGVVSFLVKGNLRKVASFVDRLKIPSIAPSMGGVDSLIEQPVIMTFWEKDMVFREKIGIFDNLVRFSLGIEDVDDIIKDLEQSFKKIT